MPFRDTDSIQWGYGAGGGTDRPLLAGVAILIKGGHQEYRADDLLYYEDCPIWFPGRKVDNPNTHGTGCTLSSAIACNLAKGLILEEAVFRAKKYLTGALLAGLNLGKGSGPLDHGYRMR